MLIKNQENIDFLAEVIASHLTYNENIDDSNTFIHFLGIFQRFISKDVNKVVISQKASGETGWELFLHREGLYDLLPEGFFHSHPRKHFKDRHETIEEFRLYRIEEKIARQFFMPLEQEFFKHLIQKEIFEQDFYYSPETIQEFIDFYNLNALDLKMYQKASLFFIMPYISVIAGNLNLTEACFEILLREKVKIILQSSAVLKTSNDTYADLNDIILGKDSMLGYSFIDCNPQLVMDIGPLSDHNSLLNFLFGINRRLIDYLIDLFIQADLTTHIRIFLNEKDNAFVLGEESYKSRLNYSTYI